MSFISAKDLIKAAHKKPIPLTLAPDTTLVANAYSGRQITFNKNTPNKTVKKFLSEWLRAAKAGRQFKANRVWDFIDFSETLDPNQPWVGLELETGTRNLEENSKLVTYIWNYLKRVAIDREGSGSYPLEVTFPPENIDKYLSGKAQVFKLLRWISKGGVNLAPFHHRCGMHANISTPNYRAGTVRPNFGSLEAGLSDSDKHEFFGREPYGYNFPRGAGKNRWIEFKLFQATADPAVIARYVKVIDKLAEWMDRGGSPPNTAGFLRGTHAFDGTLITKAA